MTWETIAEALAEHGVDTDKIKPVMRAVIEGEAKRNAVGEFNGLKWRDFAAGLLEEHPAWETPEHRRLRHAQELFDEHDHNDFGGSDALEEFRDARYGIVIADQGRSWVVAASTVRDIAEHVVGCLTTDNDDQEWIEGVYDLNDGEFLPELGRHDITFEVTIKGETFRIEPAYADANG